ncbi:MAG: acyl-CoA dehydrogenase family protein [Bacteroidia bacterium]|nr:acyl-CoA dehydrogenase family protein [Bacteroidia bacterium]
MIPKVSLPRKVYATEEHQFLKETVREYFKNECLPHREKWESQGYCDREAWLKAGELGLLCLSVEPAYGGAGLDYTYSALILEEQAKTSLAAPAFGMHCDIIAPYIQHYGTEDQKRKYLPKMISGELIGALGMTEPSTGSDLQAIKTNAVDMGDHYIINGQKTFITIGYTCDFVILACKTNPGTKKEGISLIIVDADSEGFSRGKPFHKLGMKEGDTCELFFEDVKVSKTQLLGEEGKGFIYMMTELPRERLTIASQAIGSVAGALEETIQYTQERSAFGKPICGFQNTQFKLAEVATQLELHTVFVDRCSELLAEGKLTAEMGAMAKYAASEMQGKMLDECLQLFGGYGFMWEYPISRNYASARVQRIYGGTNEIMKLVISRAIFAEYHQKLKAERKRLKTMAN